MSDETLPRDLDGREAAIGISVGGPRDRHWIALLARDPGERRYLDRGHTERPGATPLDELAELVARIVEQATRRGAVGRVRVVADVTRGLRLAERVLNAGIPGWVQTVRVASYAGDRPPTGVLGRDQVAAWVGGLAALGRLELTDAVRDAAATFQLRPEQRLATGEDAWRINDSDGLVLAVGAALHAWGHTVESDATGGKATTTVHVPPLTAIAATVPNRYRGRGAIVETAYLQGRLPGGGGPWMP